MQSGKGFVTLTGDVGAVRAAVELPEGRTNCVWKVRSFRVLHLQVFQALCNRIQTDRDPVRRRVMFMSTDNITNVEVLL